MVEEFEKFVRNCSYVKFNTKNEEHLYWGNAFAGEAGEVCNEIKKEVRDGLNKRDRIKQEMGDVLFYVAALLDSYDLTIEDSIKSQISKLKTMIANRNIDHREL